MDTTVVIVIVAGMVAIYLSYQVMQGSRREGEGPLETIGQVFVLLLAMLVLAGIALGARDYLMNPHPPVAARTTIGHQTR